MFGGDLALGYTGSYVLTCLLEGRTYCWMMSGSQSPTPPKILLLLRLQVSTYNICKYNPLLVLIPPTLLSAVLA